MLGAVANGEVFCARNWCLVVIMRNIRNVSALKHVCIKCFYHWLPSFVSLY